MHPYLSHEKWRSHLVRRLVPEPWELWMAGLCIHVNVCVLIHYSMAYISHVIHNLLVDISSLLGQFARPLPPSYSGVGDRASTASSGSWLAAGAPPTSDTSLFGHSNRMINESGVIISQSLKKSDLQSKVITSQSGFIIHSIHTYNIIQCTLLHMYTAGHQIGTEYRGN